MKKAVKLAKLSTCKQRHGAILISGGRTLAVGVNTYRNDPSMFGIIGCHYSTHAEVAALKALPKGLNLKNATMYVARISKGGNAAMSAPCSACQVALKEAGIKKVVYTIDKEMEL